MRPMSSICRCVRAGQMRVPVERILKVMHGLLEPGFAAVFLYE